PVTIQERSAALKASDRLLPLSLECHRVSSAGCNRESGRVTERHRSGCPSAKSHADGCFIVNSALRNHMMNATQLQACQTIRIRLRQWRHRLVWAREHLRWTNVPQCLLRLHHCNN
uniref:Transposase Tc1-like domain-containing protein n=1 Tax=Mola mola TaxID=94237 RepID=A0A3Q3W5R1_MOLML